MTTPTPVSQDEYDRAHEAWQDHYSGDNFEATLRACIAAAFEERGALPLEPTEAMLDAAHDCVPVTKDAPDYKLTARSIYVCMIAAKPSIAAAFAERDAKAVPKLCAMCKGSGMITASIPHENGNPEDEYDGEVDCPECKGTCYATPPPSPQQAPSEGRYVVVDRDAERKMFTDEDFNRWLDDAISDCGHTVRDTIHHGIADVWAAWEASKSYSNHSGNGDADPFAAHSSATRMSVSEAGVKRALSTVRNIAWEREAHDGRTDPTINEERMRAAIESYLSLATTHSSGAGDEGPWYCDACGHPNMTSQSEAKR